MTITEFEDAVWRLEGIRIEVGGGEDETVMEYPYRRAERNKRTISVFLLRRIKSCIGERDVIVINGAGLPVHGNTHLGTVRSSY